MMYRIKLFIASFLMSSVFMKSESSQQVIFSKFVLIRIRVFIGVLVEKNFCMLDCFVFVERIISLLFIFTSVILMNVFLIKNKFIEKIMFLNEIMFIILFFLKVKNVFKASEFFFEKINVRQLKNFIGVIYRKENVEYFIVLLLFFVV